MYKIRLPNFEGPFDLLLYFIKRDELNIYDIPIARITEEYLKYIRLMKFFDLELAGEFLVMVATLMYIKTQMLLPKSIKDSSEEIEDPRTILVQRLIEYKQFKEAARDLNFSAEDQKYVFYRKLFTGDHKIPDNDDDVYYENSTLFDLLKAFKTAIDKAEGGIKEHVVNLNAVSIELKSDYILQKLKSKKRLSFFDLIKGENSRNIVVTFLALLDMIKKHLIFIMQNNIYDDIIITGQTVNLDENTTGISNPLAIDDSNYSDIENSEIINENI